MTTFELVASGLYLVPALVWTIIARQLWWYRITRRPQSAMIRLIPIAAAVVAFHYWVPTLSGAIPGATPEDPRELVARPAHAIHEVTYLATLAVLRHVLYLSPLPERRPGGRWLAVNYGIPGLAAVAGVALRLFSPATGAGQMAGHRMFELGSLVIVVLTLRDLWRAARPGVWGPEHAGELRRPDVVVLGFGLGASLAVIPIAVALDGARFSIVLHEFLLGLAIAAPFALRMLGVVLVELAVSITLLVTLGGTVLAHVAAAPRAGRFYPFLLFVTILALGVVAGPGETWLRATVSRLLFRRSVRRHAALQEFLRTLSPELGVENCSRRALAELCRVWQLPGAALLLDDGLTLTHGDFTLEPLARVWPRGPAAQALPARALGTAELRELPSELRETLSAANVGLGAAPIVSPRRRWGFLFMNTGLLHGTAREDEDEALVAFVDQLALVLDGADLLARAVSVERSLAHSGKLAAIGELAARVAHDIRNPVSAARSLAQELARSPGVPTAAEDAAMIVGELDRVEHQVRDLLRFARRDELRLEDVHLGALVRDATASVRARLDAGGISVRLDDGEGVIARADREKLRQALLNLLDNAIDALAGVREKSLAIRIGREDGQAVLSIVDSGPGVPEDVLPRLFEPFVSSKAGGTGLGLAIARRTLDAHGGRIDASSRPGAGATFRVSLPLAGAGRIE
jgi:signal transduction histidine kinase